jgi:hypothetical protein
MSRLQRSLGGFLIVVAAFSLTSSCNSSKGTLAPPATGAEARLPEAATGCQLLEVYPNTPQGEVISIPPNGVACEHGYFTSAKPSSSNVNVVTVEQSTVYGPDCNITFNAKQRIYVIRVQQNFCFLSAGKITASVVSGPAVITRTAEGSVSGTPGRVWVSLN